MDVSQEQWNALFDKSRESGGLRIAFDMVQAKASYGEVLSRVLDLAIERMGVAGRLPATDEEFFAALRNLPMVGERPALSASDLERIGALLKDEDALARGLEDMRF